MRETVIRCNNHLATSFCVPWSLLSLPLLLNELDVKGDGNLIAYQEAAGLERGIPSQPEVLAIDLRGGRETDARVSPGIFAGALGLQWQTSTGLVHAVDGQVAGYLVLSVALLHNLG